MLLQRPTYEKSLSWVCEVACVLSVEQDNDLFSAAMSSSCPNCGLRFSDPALTPESCPSCGAAIVVVPRGVNPIRAYFLRVWQILTEPTAFFKTMPTTGGVSGPLAFALITHWLGSAVGFFWRAI